MSDDNQIATLSSVNSALKDYFPLPGTRIKQYVVDNRREDEWMSATCPVVNVDPHLDNTGGACRNEGETQIRHLEHDCCSTCDGLHVLALTMPSMQAWLTEKATRPPICADRSKLSDEIAPEYPALGEHPLFAMIPREP